MDNMNEEVVSQELGQEKLKFRDLKKSASDSKIAGVCGGFGEYTILPSWLWRVFFLVSLFMGGLGFIIYLMLWICMPSANTITRRERHINPKGSSIPKDNLQESCQA
jgi:phage shock protein PspC (stress-responsive transcriptional regulator)